jgi:hypothetical protein
MPIIWKAARASPREGRTVEGRVDKHPHLCIARSLHGQGMTNTAGSKTNMSRDRRWCEKPDAEVSYPSQGSKEMSLLRSSFVTLHAVATFQVPSFHQGRIQYE